MTLAVLLAAPPARGAFQPALRVVRPLRALAPRACADAFGPMTYRELQAACKAAGLPARGKADELRARLREQGSDGASESAPEPSPGLADAWVDVVPEATELVAEEEGAEEEAEEEEAAADTAGWATASGVDLDDALDAEIESLLGELADDDEPLDAPMISEQPDAGAGADAAWLENVLGSAEPGTSVELDWGSPPPPIDADGGHVWVDESVDDTPDEQASLRAGISRAARANDHSRVLTMASKWRRRGYGLEGSIYTDALNACAAQGVWQVGAALLNELEAGGAANALHYECALRACDRKGKWQEAMALYERMRGAGIRPSASVFESVLRVCSKARKPPTHPNNNSSSSGPTTRTTTTGAPAYDDPHDLAPSPRGDHRRRGAARALVAHVQRADALTRPVGGGRWQILRR